MQCNDRPRHATPMKASTAPSRMNAVTVRFCAFPPSVSPIVHEGGFPRSPGSAIPSGIGLAPSCASFSSVCLLLCSITRLCLKYVTQLAAHSLSNAFPSTPHAPSARSLSRMPSTMPLRSRQAKKSSRARQQCARDCRSGASNAPSAEGVGEAWDGGGGDEEVVLKRPIFCCCCCCWCCFWFGVEGT